jgi:predicted nucleic acid-binding protein
VRFWDSSAVVPLIVREPTSPAALRAYEGDPEIALWWATPLECVSALARLEREGRLTPIDVTDAVGRLDAIMLAAHEVQPVERVRQVAIRLLRVHPLRAADALQLAAAIAASEDQPGTLDVVTLDDRLALAARREGFAVVLAGSG